MPGLPSVCPERLRSAILALSAAVTSTDRGAASWDSERSLQALADAGLAGAVKTSGAKGPYVFVPLEASVVTEDVAAATRALAARAERLDPALATTAFIREDRGGQGLPRRHPGRRCDRGGGLQLAHQALCARVLLRGLG